MVAVLNYVFGLARRSSVPAVVVSRLTRILENVNKMPNF